MLQEDLPSSHGHSESSEEEGKRLKMTSRYKLYMYIKHNLVAPHKECITDLGLFFVIIHLSLIT